MLSLFWLVVGTAAVAVVLFAVMDRAKQEDQRSRHIQHRMNPFEDITITKPGD